LGCSPIIPDVLQLTGPRFPSLRRAQPRPPDAPDALVLHAAHAPCGANPIFPTARVSSIARPAAPDGVHPIVPTPLTLPPSQSTHPPSRPAAPSARRVYLALRGAVVRRCRGDQDCHVARYASKAAFPIPFQSSSHTLRRLLFRWSSLVHAFCRCRWLVICLEAGPLVHC
jgi:hypothetical protein